MTPCLAGPGRPEPLGVRIDASGANVAVFSAHAEAISLCLFDPAGEREVARIRLPERTGDVFHGHVGGLTAGTRYGLRAAGPRDPARGHRFDPTKLLCDPFATRLDRPFRLHPLLFPDAAADSAAAMPKAIAEAADQPAAPPPLLFDWACAAIYELPVRGFTMRHPEVPGPLRGTFAGLAHPAVIGYLRRLGVTAVELMPAAASIDAPHMPALGLTDAWGYNPVAFLAPDPRLAPGGWPEVRAAVAALRDAGIAVLLDVVLNHSGEYDATGPTLSLRGLDNASYYRLDPDDPSRYQDDTGCHNTLALDRPPVLRLALDALRSWALRAGLDGFRFDLATTLGRRAEGFDPAAPLLAAIDQDPVLRDRVRIAEPWDLGPGGYRLGAFAADWGEWNDQYRDTVRRFWRGDRGQLGNLATRFAGSADIFAARRRPVSRAINFVAAHDGFTLVDLVSYETKRNEANGEGNRDGNDTNYSWNHGIDGPTDDPDIRACRAADLRALLATLLLSRGTPMLAMGDECGRSQGGNNNAYAQDNETAWFDWTGLDAGLRDFTARLLRLRRRWRGLPGRDALRGAPRDGTEGFPDVAWLTPEGTPMQAADWDDAEHRTLIAALSAAGGGHAPMQRVVVILHAGGAPIDVRLPDPRAGMRWRVLLDSAAPDGRRAVTAPAPVTMTVQARSVLMLHETRMPAR
ncbi:MAG: glycogen debranching protein GlgX [Rhodospirillales bacterium]|jgi:glycogen operon protein|nr:glycogen debranching protein GlgX [Rhodospirillales bacterium]